MTAPSPIAQIVAHALNEYADYDERGEMVPNHSPGSPMFWFVGLARENATTLRGGVSPWATPLFARMLTPAARKRLRKMDIAVADVRNRTPVGLTHEYVS